VLEDQFRLTSVTKGPALTKLANELQSAAASMWRRKDVNSAMSVFRKKVPKHVWSRPNRGLEYPPVTKTHQPAWFTPLPQKVKNVYFSMQNVMTEVKASVLGIKANAAPEPTATGAAVAGGLAAVGLVGMMGAMAAM
jgi:hypothetical protein